MRRISEKLCSRLGAQQKVFQISSISGSALQPPQLIPAETANIEHAPPTQTLHPCPVIVDSKPRACLLAEATRVSYPDNLVEARAAEAALSLSVVLCTRAARAENMVASWQG